MSSPDFKTFFKAIYKLSLHMTLNDPPIELSLQPWNSMKQRDCIIEKFDFWMYNKNEFYCIDGFL